MGRLLSGHYGGPPEAESIKISLRECNQKLGLKPSDFVSAGPPKFFQKSFGTHGRYLLFQLEDGEMEAGALWKIGYYLLPLEAADVLKALSGKTASATGSRKPVDVEAKEAPPEPILTKAQSWAQESQPLFFQCKCPTLEMRLDAPWGLRRRWRARLRCPNRCQPPLTTLI